MHACVLRSRFPSDAEAEAEASLALEQNVDQDGTAPVLYLKLLYYR